MRNPNFLILDEPTNDLDIITLNVLEDYLQVFPGCLVVISHDRFFMDKLVEHIFALEGDGKLKDFPGNYTQYRNWKEGQEAESIPDTSSKAKQEKTVPTKASASEDLTHEERKQLRNWEKKIDRLTANKMKLSASFAQEVLSVKEMKDLSKQIKAIDDQIDEAEMQWMSLAEKE